MSERHVHRTIPFSSFFRWKIHGRVSYRSELRQIRGRNGLTEIISFHIQDDTGEIGVVAFDLNAQTIQDQVVQGMVIQSHRFVE